MCHPVVPEDNVSRRPVTVYRRRILLDPLDFLLISRRVEYAFEAGHVLIKGNPCLVILHPEERIEPPVGFGPHLEAATVWRYIVKQPNHPKVKGMPVRMQMIWFPGAIPIGQRVVDPADSFRTQGLDRPVHWARQTPDCPSGRLQ